MSGSAASSGIPRIFVSHSHKDDAFTQRLVSDLHGAGAEVWVDVAGIHHGNFMQRIDEALLRCDWMVLVLTPNAIASQYVKDEVYTALHRVNQGYMRAVIPVLAAACTPGLIPPQWDVLQRYDATLSYTAALAGLLNALGLAQHVPAVPGSTRTSPHQSQPTLTVPQRMVPGPTTAQTIVSRESFPRRLEGMGFVGEMGRDPETGKEVAFIRPPLCAVPAGSFLMGSDTRQDRQAQPDEQPQHEVTLTVYKIARFPVTVAEYAYFVASGHRVPSEWSTQQGKLDHPVVRVSWRDASAYAAWLAKITGQPWQLPSEAQWEKAARWDAELRASHLYPWGDRFDGARCNTSESGIRGTTAVGAYGPENPSRNGSSPRGAQEMAGNVWEWTSSILKLYPYIESDGRENPISAENRVLRGGSWNNYSKFARAACRGSNLPDVSSVIIGFRLVLLLAAG